MAASFPLPPTLATPAPLPTVLATGCPHARQRELVRASLLRCPGKDSAKPQRAA